LFDHLRQLGCRRVDRGDALAKLRGSRLKLGRERRRIGDFALGALEATHELGALLTRATKLLVQPRCFVRSGADAVSRGSQLAASGVRRR
jgi:hypothetical protein